MSRKRGKLSIEEMNFIRQNCFNISIAEIAETLNRTSAPVQKFIDKENLKMRNMSDDEHLLVGLRDRYYFKELRKQFLELRLLRNNWKKELLEDSSKSVEDFKKEIEKLKKEKISIPSIHLFIMMMAPCT